MVVAVFTERIERLDLESTGDRSGACAAFNDPSGQLDSSSYLSCLLDSAERNTAVESTIAGGLI